MTKRDTAIEIIKQKGRCFGISCDDCILYDPRDVFGCCGDHKEDLMNAKRELRKDLFHFLD